MTAISEPIVHSIATEGSGSAGWSYWSSWIVCGMQAWLDAQLRSEGVYLGDDSLLLGSLYHAFHEIAAKTRNGTYDTALVEFAMDGASTELEHLRSVAEQLYRAHRVLYPLGKDGKIEEAEQIHKVPSNAPWLPEGMDLAIKPDLVLRVGVEHSMWIRQHRDLNVPPGRYIKDYKTSGGWKSPENHEGYYGDVRFQLYIAAWNAIFPKKPVDGVLVDIAYKPTKKSPNRKPDFDMLLVRPDPNMEKIVSSMLQLALSRQREEPPVANPLVCRNWSRACRHLVAGRCGRFTP